MRNQREKKASEERLARNVSFCKEKEPKKVKVQN
jgi:hypothetical protein